MKSINKFSVKLFGLMLLSALLVPVVLSGQDENKSIRLNPEYKIYRNSNGSVTVTSRNPQEKKVRHEFNDFYADLLMAAFRKQPIDNITDSLRKKYYLSEDECRRELKRALNTLAEWKIIIRDDDLALH